jgi:hypothetical protein
MNKKSVQVLIVIETVFIIQRCHNHPPSSIPLEQKSLCLLFDSCPKKVNLEELSKIMFAGSVPKFCEFKKHYLVRCKIRKKKRTPQKMEKLSCVTQEWIFLIKN